MRLLSIYGGANSTYSILYSFRIKKVVIGGISSAVNKVTSFSFKWLGTNAPVTETISNGNTERPFKIVAIPPRNSTCGFWNFGQDNSTLFSVATDADFGAGTVDVYLEVTLVDGTPHSAIASVLAAPTIGSLYTMALDNTDTGGANVDAPKWIPQGRETIS